MNDSELQRLRQEQAGVVSRRQILATVGTKADLDRLLRHRELTRLLPGVFIDHTAPPTWLQRAWAGVLFHWPAALGGHSALRAAMGPGWRRHRDDGPIEIAVPQHRHVSGPTGYVISRRNDFWGRVQWSAAPPRVRIEQAGLDVAVQAPGEFELIATLADLCLTRRTTAPRLLETLAGRGAIPRRQLLRGVLDDLAGGTCSVLEHGFVHRVELPHSLPTGTRQAPGPQGSLQDVAYRGLPRPLVVELDGRLFHDSAQSRDRDLDRDLLSALHGADTVRLGWGQVFDRPCWTAGHLAALLQRHGWAGTPVPCSAGCRVAATGAYGAPGAPYAPVGTRTPA